tara:strand:+ start:40 stop:750 length:711 start_codon:yes stop_codon:yes gene_type:complete
VTDYKFKNYLLTMQSHWCINQNTYETVQESMPIITKFKAQSGVEKLQKTPINKIVKKIYPDVYKVPLFRRQFCKMLVDEIQHMGFNPNETEDELRQIPEIVLHEKMPQLHRNMWYIVQTVLNPIFFSLWQRHCANIGSVQIANYNIKDKKQGAYHHDDSADLTVVVPLNTGKYEGGGTEFHNYGVVPPLPTGHALMFPSFTMMHKGLPVQSGDRYLLVFWLYDRARVEYLNQHGLP